jgi:tetratricopeptide (TPR) repeat protein
MSACTQSRFSRRNPSADFFEAQEHLNREAYDQSRAILEPYLEQELDSKIGSRVHFLLGLATFYPVRDELETGRKGVGRMMGLLSGQQIRNLNDAAGHFHAAIEADPSSAEAAESLYLLGLLHDFGYLQRFDESMMYYQRCFDEYPGTEAARRAEERYRILKEISGGIQGTPHGK